jgi:hypothetical protein
MQKDSRPFAKLKELQSQLTKPTAQFAAHLILPNRTQAHPPPHKQTHDLAKPFIGHKPTIKT